MRERSERPLLQAALLISSAVGVGQLLGLLTPVHAQTGSGLQQNKLEQEQLRERLDERQKELKKPLPITEPGQVPLTEPGVDDPTTSDEARCEPGLFRVNRITLVDDSGEVLALDCHAPEAGFFTTTNGPAARAARLRDRDPNPRRTCLTSTARICTEWRELRQIQSRLRLVEGLDFRSGAGPQPSISFAAVAEQAADPAAVPETAKLEAPLPPGLQLVQKRIVQEISRNSEQFLGLELSQDSVLRAYQWLRDVQNQGMQGTESSAPLDLLEKRWQDWLNSRPERERPGLRNAKRLMDLLNQISVEAIASEGYLGKVRLPILNFAWGELRITRLSTLLSRFGKLKENTSGVCRDLRSPSVPIGASTTRPSLSPIAWDWVEKTVAGDLTPGSLFRVDKLSSAVLKLNELGGVSAEMCIEGGDSIGTSDVLLSLKRTPVVKADVQLDNYVVRYTGPYEIQGAFALEGAFRKGERIGFTAGYSGNVDWYGSRQLGMFANVPLTPGGLSVVGGLNWADYRSLEQFTPDNYTGFYTSGLIGLNQVLWRRPRSGLSARLVGTLNHYEDSVFNAITYDNRTSAVGRFSLLGDFQDRLLGPKSPSYNAGQLTFSFGELSRAAEYASYYPGDGGTLGKANLTFNRLQTFAGVPRLSLAIQGQFQVAFSNLNVAEELSLGWPNGVRAYPPGEVLGDTGLVGQLTARYDLLPDRSNPSDRRRLALKAFLDGGYVWRWSNPFQSGYYPGELGLWGPGVGLEWGREKDYSVSIDVAWPLGQNRARLNGLDVDGLNPDARVWVGLRKWL